VKFDKFRIAAMPFITDAYCECGGTLQEVSNGFLSRAMFCPRCENVYLLKLIKVPKKKLTERFMEQAREEAARADKKR
jgi:hypothetical protein